MKTKNKLLLLTVLLFCTTVFAQQKPFMYGVMIDEKNEPIEGVSVFYDLNGKRTEVFTNQKGYYKIVLPANTPVDVYFAHISFKLSVIGGVELENGREYEFSSIMMTGITSIDTVTIEKLDINAAQGLTPISPDLVLHIPGANQDIATVLKTFAGFNSNNEMSTGYNVRGGNFDENLVYVNDIEIYRPFLIRSGQQEGLSFTNTAMVKNVVFSAGGFQTKYGDKLSSVLDITYRKPEKFAAALEASFLGGSLTVESASKDKKWSGIVGARYRDNSLLVNSQQTETNFKPTFADVQTFVTFTPNKKWEFSFLGNISQNVYSYEPLTRQTNFGTIDDPQALVIYYQGQEKDEYKTYFGAFTSDYKVSDNFRLKFIGSVYHTQEQEHFDILAEYALGDVDTNLDSETYGDIQFARGVGSQLTHARNNLDALIANAEVKGYHGIGKDSIQWGFKYTREDIRDRLMEWEVVDSAGFSLTPPYLDYNRNEQPYTPYTGPLVPYQNISSVNFAQINRLSGYVQWSRMASLGDNKLFLNAGVRAHQWQVKQDNGPDGDSQIVISPRAQVALKPSWENTDMLFRLSGGLYYQPPFYRELRDSLGIVQPNVKAQRSIHVVAGHDYNFTLGKDSLGNGKKFKLVTEVYYKKLDDVNTYTLENVRIRYRANNNATAYAYGADVRLNGDFVPGTDSWISFGYMKTEEKINNRGYIARPTDQRLKFGLLFQDYMPAIENLKMYLNLVYNTGLPGGSPSYADSYAYQTRLKDYRRADVGFSYVFAGNNLKNKSDARWLQPFKELSVGLEIFNLFNNLNSITNTWVRDADTGSQYGIPNYLTSRVFSLKLLARI